MDMMPEWAPSDAEAPGGAALPTMEDAQAALARSMAGPRQEARGEGWCVVNNDTVLETARMPAASVDLIVTSIPFATQYEYTPTFNDFGHTDDNDHFWRQMDFLSPNLLRVLRPGRVMAVHVKDRIVPGGLTGLGFQTLHPFSDEAVAHYKKHGFAFLARKTITTDVVRENNQTYRLGWSEQCKDGSRMGCGVPEYLLLFRRPPSDPSTGYADVPVVKEKPLCADAGEAAPFDKKTNWRKPVPGTGYSRAKWQLDAHGYTRTGGDRLLSGDELRNLPHEQLYKWWEARSTAPGHVYDYREHLLLCERLDEMERLPSTFMLWPPHSVHPDVWTDITRMRTLNADQAMAGREQHLCLARGSLVLTAAGWKPIEDVQIGDLALTHRGRWRPVTGKIMTGNRPVVALKAQGVAALRLTPDHKLWSRMPRASAWHQAHAKASAMRAEPGWTRADATPGGYVNTKLPPLAPCDLSEQEAWLLGRWLADGHRGTRGDFYVSVGREKLSHFLEMAGLHAGARHEGTAVQVRLKGLSDALRRALGACGEHAHGKQVPVGVLSAPAGIAAAVLRGYFAGDGHHQADRGRWTSSSVSRALLLGLAMLAQRAHGAIASVYAGRAPGTTTIEGREVRTRQDWAFGFEEPDAHRKNGLPFILEDGAWKKVRSAEPDGEAETWCLKVEEDESFTAEGCIVKNCPLQLDIVDRAITQFSMPGEVVFDPFAGIGTVPVRALKLGRQGIGTELSPRYWADAATYCRAEEARQAVPSLFDLLGVPAVEEDA